MSYSSREIPRHIAIIPDGNRRWAQTRGLTTFEGHHRGIEALKELVSSLKDMGIEVFTFWAFSTENWQRPSDEVEYLMQLAEGFLRDSEEELMAQKIRFHHLGRRDRLPEGLAQEIAKVEELTKENKDYSFNLALDYGGRDEMLRAVRKVITSGVKPEELSEELFASFLDTCGQPEPDLIIRTSGELRTSGLMLWQSAYSELYFVDCYFPDFTPAHLKLAIEEYSKRMRRFGR